MSIDFYSVVRQLSLEDFYDGADWLEWRYCYEGGQIFRDQYLEKFSDREDQAEFERRRKLTPIPTYARREINRVKNSLSQRFPDITRRGGTKVWRDAVAGIGRGVDRRGSTMNSFITKMMLAELLVMGRVGVLVDAPRVTGGTAADVPAEFRPYLNRYQIERIPTRIPADVESTSDWSAIRVEDRTIKMDPKTGAQTDECTYRYYYLDESRGNLVTIQRLSSEGAEIEEPIFTNLTEIPFVMFDIGGSLIKDVCSHQIALLNMISSDSNYAIDSNYPFMVRQRGNSNAGAYLIGDDDEATVGVRKGLFYEKGLNPPAFISPPSDPMRASLELRRELKDEVRELVSGAIADLGEDGSLEAGLAFIGACLADGESRLWDHWAAYENADPARRKIATVSYPECWSLKTDLERVEEADKLLDLMNKLPGQSGKKEAAKMAYDKLYRGKLPTEKIDSIKKQVDDAPYTTSDAAIIIDAKREGLVGPETGSLALGFNADEWKKAEEAQARRAEAIVAAQADAAAGAARGADDLSQDSNAESMAREGDSDTSAKLGGDDQPGVRGDGDAN